MKSSRLQTRFIQFTLAILLFGGFGAPGPAPVRTEARPYDIAAPQDVPWALVPGGVTSYALVSSQYKIFWHTAMPPCTPASVQAGQAVSAAAERISRIATYGSLTRVLYEQAGCGASQIQSNLVADESYVYWVGTNGLMRLSVNANPGDAPELVNGLFSGRAELAVDGIHIFVLAFDNNNYGTIYRVEKSTGTRIFVAGAGQNASNLQTSYSFSGGVQRYYVYWLEGTDLRRFNLDTLSSILIATGVTGYYAEGGRFNCIDAVCFFSDSVFYGVGRQAYVHNNLTGTITGPIYTSTDPTARIFSLTADGSNLFPLERRDASCAPFTCYNYVILRSGRSNDSGQVPIYTTGALIGLLGPDRLTTDGKFLFWQENQNGSLQRLPNDASALPQTNMRVTGIEVTQGIQSLNNNVLLIKNRRTFVRVYVQSDGPAVAGVTARLSATWNGGGSDLPLLPVNPWGNKLLTQLTVQPGPNRDDINQSFLFDLPLDWTTKSNLVLRAELNPYHVPLQTDYSNNVMQLGPLTFWDSPRLTVHLVQFQYVLTGTVYSVPMSDTLQAISLVRRLFPLASTPGWYTDASPGFRPRLWTLLDGGLGSRVNTSAEECKSFITVKDGKTLDNRNLCSTAYANNQLRAFRAEQGLGDKSFMYGLISPRAGFGVRGQAFGDLVASGASDNPRTAAHEIAHTAGRDHPFTGSSLDNKVCGNTPDDGPMDQNYPYTNGSIGPANGSYEGFDGGDPALGLGPAVRPSSGWYDIISYCGPKWIGDYTYRGIYKFFFPNAPVSAGTVEAPQASGDWLSAFGLIATGGQSASFTHVRRLSNVAEVLPQEPGGYRLRLRNAQGGLLADYAFTPEVIHEGGGVMAFGLIVPFVVGTSEIQLVSGASQVIASRRVSANPPNLSNVALRGAPNPVTGTVTLGWTAGDADGDALTFDILYSRDGGATFQPLLLGVTGNTAPIDTSRLGGGTAILRIIASDGVLSTQADSTPFTMANKPPTPHIDSPGDGTRFQYGQLIHFFGGADDPQDGSVSSNGLVWRDQFGNVLGNGPVLSRADLRVGTNVITLTATNSRGLSAGARVTVIVDDDLRLPGPILSVGPAQVNWHVAPGTTAPQTAPVGINNAGGGTLNWTASSDQAWLTLSAGNGSAPSILTFTADLAGLADGTTRTAHVIITKPANGDEPAQAIVIPVLLSMGNVVDIPLAVLDKRVYLPLIRR